MIHNSKLPKTHKISFTELNKGNSINKEFMCPKEHLSFHLQNLRKIPNIIQNLKVNGVTYG